MVFQYRRSGRIHSSTTGTRHVLPKSWEKDLDLLSFPFANQPSFSAKRFPAMRHHFKYHQGNLFFLFTTLQAKRADVHVALYRTQLNFAFAVTAAVAVTRATAAWTANELKISFGQLSYCSAYHIFFHSYNSSPSSKSRHSLDRSQLET